MAISLTVIDALNYTPSLKAIHKTLDTLGDKITKVYWFSDIDYPVDKRIDTQWIKIPKFQNYNDEYGFITLKLCPHICVEDYNLIVHADGFAVNSEAWTDEFLEYDYIGAAWKDGGVGNGGFSLRSRKLYDAMISIGMSNNSSDYSNIIDDPNLHVITNGEKLIPEDNIICKIYKFELTSKYGIKFAPLELANRFSVEHYPTEWLGKSLGFHGKHGIAQIYNVTI
jgi:hypothetical protein